MKHRNLGKNQYRKAKVRNTPEWRQFRILLQEHFNGLDALTLKKLRLGWNAHHMDMSLENYDLLELNRFVPLNKASHNLIHILYRYYKNDESILQRLKEILDKMLEFDMSIHR